MAEETPYRNWMSTPPVPKFRIPLQKSGNYMFATAPALPPRPGSRINNGLLESQQMKTYCRPDRGVPDQRKNISRNRYVSDAVAGPLKTSLNKLDDDYDDGGMVIPMAQTSQWKKEETLKTLPVEESRDADNQKAPSFSEPAQAKNHSTLCLIILFVLVIISLAMSAGALSWFLMKNFTLSEELQAPDLNYLEMLTRVKEDLDELKTAQKMHDRTIKDSFSELQDITVSLCEKSKVSFPCPTNWKADGKMCYFFSKEKKNWNDALSSCINMKAHLVSIWSDEEEAFLLPKLGNSSIYWLGLTYLEKEKKWQWKDDDRILSISFWDKGEPQKGGNKNCGIMHPNGTWASAVCSLSYHWICKKQLIC